MQITDQLGRLVRVPDRPKRVLSLCPSQTETLAVLVAQERILGCTDYCRHPADLISHLPKVGGTKSLNIDAIRAMTPDLIIAVKEENDVAQIEALSEQFPLLILDPVDLASALDGVALMGEAVGERQLGKTLHEEIASALEKLKQAKGQRALYLIWRKPYMAAGSGTYIDAMMGAIGLVNAGADLEGRYPLLDEEATKRAKPQLILAASEPFPFQEKHRRELMTQFPDCKIILVDGEAFGWHGVRLLHVTQALARLVDEINLGL